MSYITRQQDKNLIPALIAACAGVVLLGINVAVTYSIIKNGSCSQHWWLIEVAPGCLVIIRVLLF